MDQSANIARIVQALQALVLVTNALQQTILTALPPPPGSPPLGQR